MRNKPRLELDLTAVRWTELRGGYRVPFDPRRVVDALNADPSAGYLWDSLIEDSYHQGDVGEASYLGLVLLIQSDPVVALLSWQLLSLAVMIELARKQGTNPDVPSWLAPDYCRSLDHLASLCIGAIAETTKIEELRGMLAVIALRKGLRVYARAIESYSEDELEEMFTD